MDTVNFKCGNCGQVIAVLAAHVGQQVRCPHCQQAVTAPPPDSPPSINPPAESEPIFPTVSREESESIFSEPTLSEDLFGQPSGKVELPPEMTATEPAGTFPNMELGPSPPSPALQQEPTLTYMKPEPPLAPAPSPEVAPPQEAPAPWLPTSDAVPPSEGDASAPVLPTRPRAGRGWHIALVIFPLVSYAILATIAVAVLYVRLQDQDKATDQKTQPAGPAVPSGPHPLEHLPDLQGEHPTGQRPKQRFVDTPEEFYYTMAPKTVLQLGQTATIGDIEVTPLRVERGVVETLEKGRAKPEQLPGEAVKLYLRMKNVSKSLAFYPMDRFFNRYYNMTNKKDELRYSDPKNPPLTGLVVNAKPYYGGPAGYWDPETDKREFEGVNEMVVGTNVDKKLQPGETMETFVCTDPQNEELQAALKQNQGRLLWRVHFRRGAVEVKGRRHPVPATAVIGVEFSDKDIKPAG